MTRRVVGILGGMGPEATILLQQRLLGVVNAQDDADHLPLLIDMNPQVPSRIKHLIEGQGETPAPVLADMARGLQAAGATALAMPCNTAHHYADAILGAVDVPFLDMVALSVATASTMVKTGSKIGFLASPAVQKTGVFDPALAANGFSALWPEDDDRMLAAIREIKRDGATKGALAVLQTAANELNAKGASLILIACSEFSLFTGQVSAPVPVIDTIDVLAEAIRDHIRRD